MAPWGFEDIDQHEWHTRQWASGLGCDKPEVADMISCLKALPVIDITKSAGNYSVSP